MTSSIPWRKSSFSSGAGSCVEMSRDADGQIFVRNSNHPDAGTLAVTAADLQPWLAAFAVGSFDDLA